jgi:hypothetical protein
MPDIYVINDTIRFTASIADISGNVIDPDTVTIKVISPDETVLLEKTTALRESEGSYYYNWTINGIEDNANLIAIWEWEQGGTVNVKRQKFRVVPETDY